ncbi:hypothetical protein ACJIZ3_024553 [Penstemon smallii]|uniref:Uncharacterized protein n=1 Tax=Penstemon smallii TaxID=265156 RepID=A0ABD3TUQ5_9LAMI
MKKRAPVGCQVIHTNIRNLFNSNITMLKLWLWGCKKKAWDCILVLNVDLDFSPTIFMLLSHALIYLSLFYERGHDIEIS